MTHLVLLILSLSLSPVYHHLTPISISHPISPIPIPPPISPITSIFSPTTTLFTRSSFNTLFLPSQPITRSGPQSSLLSLTGTIYTPRR
ncbi:wsv089 [White spot syndrome virus]|uniref:Wsv089 n=1 Tax=White spot syndrome virus TaxID=342409 RepID=A0A1Z2R9D1_9VIRU|nr:wsv089 [White spot syndrome virus]